MVSSLCRYEGLLIHLFFILLLILELESMVGGVQLQSLTSGFVEGERIHNVILKVDFHPFGL